MSVRFSKQYINDYGITTFSDTFFITGEVMIPTKKFNRTNVGIKLNEKDEINLLKEHGIKFYGNIVYVELKDNYELDDNEISVCIKKFKNLKGETFTKLVSNTPREEF